MVKQARKTQKLGRMRKVGKQARPRPTRMAKMARSRKTRTTKTRVRKLSGGKPWESRPVPDQETVNQYYEWRNKLNDLEAEKQLPLNKQQPELHGQIAGLLALMQHYRAKYKYKFE